MRLIWAVIPLVLFGIIGYQESLAQTNDLNDYPGEWHVGEGLKQGDYFEYSLCHADYDDCTPIVMNMWIKGDIQVDSETKWLAEVVVYDGNKVVVGEMELGKIAPEPAGGSEALGVYRDIFKSSVTGLSVFATASGDDPNLGPKQFSDKTWNPKLISMGTIGGPFPLKTETLSLQSGIFDTVVVGWNIDGYDSQDNKIWIVDGFPFPVKAVLYEFDNEDVSENLAYEFELLEYHENVVDDPFVPVYVPESFAEENTSIQYSQVINHESGEFEVLYSITNATINKIHMPDPHFPILQFEFTPVNDGNLKIHIPQNSPLGLGEGCTTPPYVETSISGKIIPNYVDSYHVLSFEFDKNTKNIEIMRHDPAWNFGEQIDCVYSELYSAIHGFPSPKKLHDVGFPTSLIQCNSELVMIVKSSYNSPACVKPSTAEKLIQRGWMTHDTKTEQKSSKILPASKTTFSKTILDDKPPERSVLAGMVMTHYDSLEYPEYVQVGEEFDVTVRWTFTEYDEEGNVEYQNLPVNSLTKEIFDETSLRIKIPENVELISELSDWKITQNTYHDTSYNFDSTFTTYAKVIPFDYTKALHEQTYRFKLVEPFFPPFDYMTFGGLGFSKTIYHQDGSLVPPHLDEESINALQSAITVERLGSDDPQYPEVPASEVNWGRAYDVAPKGINIPAEPDDAQLQKMADFSVDVLKRNFTSDESVTKSDFTQEILASYNEKLEKTNDGQSVLLASSLEPFEDDGREYRHKILEHYPAPTLYYDMIKYGWIDTTGFETDEYGIVTYLDEPHEKYSLNPKKGFYLEDWIPENIPDGQRLLYAQTGYSTYEKNELVNEKYVASYNFVPINFIVDENTTSYDLEHNRGFRVSISYDSWQDEIEDILEEQKERHAKKSGNYGGYKTMMRDGEMVILFEGGYTGRHYENSIYWIFDDNYSISVRSHYYTLDELIPIFSSIIENGS